MHVWLRLAAPFKTYLGLWLNLTVLIFDFRDSFGSLSTFTPLILALDLIQHVPYLALGFFLSLNIVLLFIDQSYEFLFEFLSFLFLCSVLWTVHSNSPINRVKEVDIVDLTSLL